MSDANTVIGRVRDLPSLPAVVVELLMTMEQPDIDTHALAARIALDQALTAKTLRLANSSFYGLQSKVTSIAQAIAVLGFHSIRTLVTACSITASFPRGAAPGFDFEAFWRHAIAGAACARVLARLVGVSADTAFTAGLLHDLGTLVLASLYPLDYQQVVAWQRAHDCSTAQAEQQVFGTDHTAVGAALAEHWKFPLQIRVAVAAHHVVLAHDSVAPADLTSVIQAANVLAHALDLGNQEHDQVPPLSLALWRTLDKGAPSWPDVFSEIEALYHDVCQTLTP